MEAQTVARVQHHTTFTFPRQFNQVYQLPISPKFTSFKTMCIQSEKYGITSDVPAKKMFILGLGYVAQFFAQQLINEGWDISGTCTSITKKKELEQRGFHAHVFDACQPELKIFDMLSCYTHLLVSVPPTETVGDPVLQHKDQLRTRLTGGNLQWVSYLSSTMYGGGENKMEGVDACGCLGCDVPMIVPKDDSCVYGDSEGAWVDEDYSPKPSTNIGKTRLSAEDGWLKLGKDLNLSTYVFRLGGIYGPGRSAIDTILKKEQLSSRQKRRANRNFTSRVHGADICQALRATFSMKFRSKIYNVVDDDPAPRAEVFEFAHQLINTKWPGLVTADDTSVEMTHASGGEKRVLNARIKKELGVKLLHPSYRSGLKSIIDSMADPIS